MPANGGHNIFLHYCKTSITSLYVNIYPSKRYHITGIITMNSTIDMITILIVGIALRIIIESTPLKHKSPRKNFISMPGFLILWAIIRVIFRPRFNLWDIMLFVYIYLEFQADGNSWTIWLELLLGIFISSVFQSLIQLFRTVWNNDKNPEIPQELSPEPTPPTT